MKTKNVLLHIITAANVANVFSHVISNENSSSTRNKEYIACIFPKYKNTPSVVHRNTDVSLHNFTTMTLTDRQM